LSGIEDGRTVVREQAAFRVRAISTPEATRAELMEWSIPKHVRSDEMV